MNWTVIIIVAVLVLALVIFLVVRNQQDEKQFEKKVKNDFPRSGSEDDIEIREPMQ